VMHYKAPVAWNHTKNAQSCSVCARGRDVDVTVRAARYGEHGGRRRYAVIIQNECAVRVGATLLQLFHCFADAPGVRFIAPERSRRHRLPVSIIWHSVPAV
jgi:hypothetical protein